MKITKKNTIVIVIMILVLAIGNLPIIANAKPSQPKISSLTAGKNKLTVKYNKVKLTKKYQISYNVKDKNPKIITTTATKKTITGLKNKIYFVKVRAVRDDNYSKWSKTRSVQVEKYNHSHTFEISYYCPCSKCNGNSKGITASGRKLTPNLSIAVDKSIIPLGTKVCIDGKEYRADDTGGAIRGYKIDVCVESHSKALKNGKVKKIVKW